MALDLSGLKKPLKKAGAELARPALLAWFVATDLQTPQAIRIKLFSALAYFISPIDAIADFLPLGYTDDLALLAFVISSVTANIKDSHKQQAQQLIERWTHEKII